MTIASLTLTFNFQVVVAGGEVLNAEVGRIGQGEVAAIERDRIADLLVVQTELKYAVVLGLGTVKDDSVFPSRRNRNRQMEYFSRG